MKKFILASILLSSVAMGYEVPEPLKGGQILVKTRDGKTTEFSADKWKVVPRTDAKPSTTSPKPCCPQVVEKPCPVCPTCPVVAISEPSYGRAVAVEKLPEPNRNRLSVLSGLPTDMFEKRYEVASEYNTMVTPISLLYTRDFFDNLHATVGHVWSAPNFFVIGGGFNW